MTQDNFMLEVSDIGGRFKSEWFTGELDFADRARVLVSFREWLLFNRERAIFQPYHSENKLHFDEMMMSTLY